MSAFAFEDGAVYHTYSAFARGLDGMWGMYQWLDRAPKGRNESEGVCGDAMTSTVARAIQRRVERLLCLNAGPGGRASHEPRPALRDVRTTGSTRLRQFPAVMTAQPQCKNLIGRDETWSRHDSLLSAFSRSSRAWRHRLFLSLDVLRNGNAGPLTMSMMWMRMRGQTWAHRQ